MKRLAERTQVVVPSAVREILKVAEQPEVRSFAGGLPAPELFPVEAFAQAHQRVLERAGPPSLQYSTTEGFGPLREWVAQRFRTRGVPTSSDEVLITSGAQQALDLVARVLLDPGAVVVTENPTYVAAIQVFQAAQARIVVVESDREGIVLEDLARVLATHDVRLLYTVPNFGNPTGVTWTRARRAGAMALTQAWGVPVLEDDPYEALRFRGQPVPPLVSMDDSESVLSVGTFSKMLAPGLRIGWIRAPESIRKHLVVAKQAADLHSSSLGQRVMADLLEHFDLEAHLDGLRVAYGNRCELMARSVRESFPHGTSFTRPDGGLFLWVELPEAVDAMQLLQLAVSRYRVAYVPGAPFYAVRPKANTVRLNFSNCKPTDIVDSMTSLGELFGEVAFGPRPADRAVRAGEY